MIVAALGAVAGMFCFFHGFSVLQEHRLSLARTVAKIAAQSATLSAPPLKAQNAPKRESHEVIQLSTAQAQPNDSASMTQQGKIAAALLKAGIPNPVTWSAPVQVAVAAEEKALLNGSVARVRQPGAVADPFHIPALEQKPHHSPDWKCNLMIWGGPVLALGCIYILAAHFGWL